MDAGGRHSCQPIPLQKDRETGPEQALVSEQRDISVKAVKALNDIGVRVVEVYHRHQKVIIIDEHTVMLGSLNALRRCGSATKGYHYYWRCYSETCPAKGRAAPGPGPSRWT